MLLCEESSSVLETMRPRAELLDRACQSVYTHDKRTAATQQTHWLHTHVWLQICCGGVLVSVCVCCFVCRRALGCQSSVN